MTLPWREETINPDPEQTQLLELMDKEMNSYYSYHRGWSKFNMLKIRKIKNIYFKVLNVSSISKSEKCLTEKMHKVGLILDQLLHLKKG